jgi:hypothetical protein
MKRHLIALALLSACAAAAAPAAPWIDDRGRFLVMQFPGLPEDKLVASGHDLAAAAALFKKLCLDTTLERESAGKQAVEAGWGFSYRPLMVPFKEPIELGGWVAKDAALNVGSNLFFNKHSQCSLTVAVTGPADSVASEAAMSTLLGVQPGNADKALDGKGKRKKYYEPEWAVVDPATGSMTTVYVRPVANSKGQVQLAALRKANK